ncbi:MAG: hypothetical protein AAGA68_27305 [Pseudomonadota bacterium]
MRLTNQPWQTDTFSLCVALRKYFAKTDYHLQAMMDLRRAIDFAAGSSQPERLDELMGLSIDAAVTNPRGVIEQLWVIVRKSDSAERIAAIDALEEHCRPLDILLVRVDALPAYFEPNIEKFIAAAKAGLPSKVAFNMVTYPETMRCSRCTAPMMLLGGRKRPGAFFACVNGCENTSVGILGWMLDDAHRWRSTVSEVQERRGLRILRDELRWVLKEMDDLFVEAGGVVKHDAE